MKQLVYEIISQQSCKSLNVTACLSQYINNCTHTSLHFYLYEDFHSFTLLLTKGEQISKIKNWDAIFIVIIIIIF